MTTRTIVAASKKSLNALPADTLSKILISLSGRTGMSEEAIFDMLADGWTYHEDIERSIMDEEQREEVSVTTVQHDPTRWNSLGPKALSEMINDIAEDCGLDREIVYILLTQQWEYTYKTDERNPIWTKTDG